MSIPANPEVPSPLPGCTEGLSALEPPTVPAAPAAGLVRRVFTPQCPKCHTTFPAPRLSLPPRRWECPTRGCSGRLWQPDESSTVCDVCRAAISKFTRHHCRRCGFLTCGGCLSFQTVLSEWSATEKQRVCRRCAVPEVPASLSGWLLKLSQRNAFFGQRFHEQFFELRGTVLLYGKPRSGASSGAAAEGCPNASNGSEAEEKLSPSPVPTDAAQLVGCIDVIGAKVMDVAIHPHAFCIVGPRLPSGYVLSAPSAEEKARWVEAIQTEVRLARSAGDEEGFEDDLERTENVLFAKDKSANVSVKDFELRTVLGLGSFGRVMRVRHKATGDVYAMKILDKGQIVSNKMVTHTTAEKLILSEISHPFVVKLYYAFQTRKHLILVLEFLCGGELFFHLQRNKCFSESRARFYAAEIGMAVDYIHSQSVLYRDLKPENLVLDREGHVVLTDFGLAKRELAGDERTHTFCGTPEYMAPELVKKSGHTTAVDWWSLGIFIYEMVSGMPPFYSQNVPEMYEMILHKPLICPPNFSPELCSLLERLLDKDPATRMKTGAEFRAHPFFSGLDFEKLLRREIKPEFVPDVKRNDLRYFDKQFLKKSTKIPNLDQPVDPSDPVSRAFEGYEYNPNA